MQAKKIKIKHIQLNVRLPLQNRWPLFGAKFSTGLQQGSTIPLVHKIPDNSFPAQGRSPELADFCYFVLFFLKTHSDVTAEDQLGLKVSWWGGSSSIWRSVFTGASRLPADLGNRHPEKVLQGLSHLLWTDVVNWMSWCLIGQKKKTKDLRDISFVAVCIFFLIISHYIPLVGGTAVSLLWCSFNIFITGSCHHPPRLFYWFIWELHTTKKPTTLWAENTIAQAL